MFVLILQQRERQTKREKQHPTTLDNMTSSGVMNTGTLTKHSTTNTQQTLKASQHRGM